MDWEQNYRFTGTRRGRGRLNLGDTDTGRPRAAKRSGWLRRILNKFLRSTVPRRRGPTIINSAGLAETVGLDANWWPVVTAAACTQLTLVLPLPAHRYPALLSRPVNQSERRHAHPQRRFFAATLPNRANRTARWRCQISQKFSNFQKFVLSRQNKQSRSLW